MPRVACLPAVGALLLVLPAAAVGGTVNPAIGTWKLNPAESIAAQGMPLRPFTVVVRRADEVLDFTYREEGAGAPPFEFTYDGPADGVVRDLGGGLKGSMARLPSGNYEARLWSADGSLEDKFCELDASGRKDICLATVTAANGAVVFYKEILDRQ